MWETSMKGLLSLIRRSTPSSFAYICEKNGDSLTDKVIWVTVALVWHCYFIIGLFHFLLQHFIFMQMDELACFAPGMLALASSDYGPDEAKKFLSLAEEVFLLA